MSERTRPLTDVIREKLAATLGGMAVALRPENEIARHGELVTGTLAYPAEIADALLDTITPAALAAPETEDEEVAIMARIARLDLEDPAAARRIVEWASKRWGD